MQRYEQRERDKSGRDTGARRPERTHAPVLALDKDELSALRTIGAFRVVASVNTDRNMTERLVRKGLVARHTVKRSDGSRGAQVVSATELGMRHLDAYSPHDDKQRYWHGVVKEQEVEHDLVVYKAFQKEAEAIEEQGGKINRIVMDFEFKSEINGRLNDAREDEHDFVRQQIAEEYDLPYIDGKALLPDCRIEYTDEHGVEQHRDIEVLTKNYRGSARAAKMSSGFKLYQGYAGGKIRDDHQVTYL